jgi:tetratricopeptide (TPR) repeat protein
VAAENAGKLAKKLIENKSIPDDRVWLAFHNLMVIYDRNADDDSLLETANFVLKHNNQDWQAKYFKALVNLRRDDYAEGKKLLESANSIQPNSPEILLNLAFIYETVDKNYDKALETLHKAESNIDQPSTLLQNNIAYALLKKGDVDAAGKILESDNINQEHPVFLATYGLYYYHRNDVKKADKYYKLSVQTFRGKEKQIAIQLWHTEKARYYLRHNNLVDALQEVNMASKALKSGYSYDDALALKEEIIGKVEAIVLNNASTISRV